MSFFVIAKGSWGIPPQEFVHHLRSRWPEVDIRENNEPASSICLYFELLMPHSRVDGGLDCSGQSFHFDSDLRDAAQLALWFRSLAPGTEPMVFCDDSMSGMLELEPDTTEVDIFRAFDYTPAPAGWMNYSFVARKGWGLPVKELAQQLRKHWPSAQLVENTDPDSRWVFEFHVPMPHSKVSGKVEQKVSAMVFTGDLRDCAEFALWCRSVLPTTEFLLMCDQGSLQLEADTSADEIIRAFSKAQWS